MTTFNEQALRRFTVFVAERHSIYEKRRAGFAKPWTTDRILQAYRFCNVYRELDTVTKYIDARWRNGAEVDNWLDMVVCRLVNWPETLNDLRNAGVYGKWDVKTRIKFVDTMHARKYVGDKVFSSAYIVSTNGHAMDKAEYLAEYVIAPLWAKREHYRPTRKDTLASFHARLSGANGLGSFMAAQVVADVKNTERGPLMHAADWWTWAAPGPGSLRGLTRVLYGALPDGKAKVSTKQFLPALLELREELRAPLTLVHDYPDICAQDVQNCLCEFDKYERVRRGEGKPRQGYPGR